MPSDTAAQGGPSLGLMRGAALAALAVGAVGSVALMLYAGRTNDLRLLKVLFTIWVLSPFVALGWAHAASKGWPHRSLALLHSVTIGVAAGSLAIYAARVVWPPKAQAAFVFVAVPPTSWVVMGIALTMALLSRRSR